MIRPLLIVSIWEYSGLASLAYTVAIGGGVLVQIFTQPEAVVFYAVASAMLFGALGGLQRSRTNRLEFLLSRNISRRHIFVLRWILGACVLTSAVLIAGINLIFPASSFFWAFFVESGFTVGETLPLRDGLGWGLFALCSALWTYSVSFYLVSRSRDAAQVMLALLGAIGMSLALPLLCLGFAELMAAADVVERGSIYTPLSSIWSMFFAVLIIGTVALLVHGLKCFARVDIA